MRNKHRSSGSKSSSGDDGDPKGKGAYGWVAVGSRNYNWIFWSHELARDPKELSLVVDKYSVAKRDASDTIGMNSQ